MRICLSVNRWQLYLWSDGPHIQRSSPDCHSVHVNAACNRPVRGWKRCWAHRRPRPLYGHGKPHAMRCLTPCPATETCSPPKRPSSARGCPATGVTPNLQHCPQPSAGLSVSWSTGTSTVCAGDCACQAQGEEEKRLQQMLSGTCLDRCFHKGIDRRWDQSWESQLEQCLLAIGGDGVWAGGQPQA